MTQSGQWPVKDRWPVASGRWPGRFRSNGPSLAFHWSGERKEQQTRPERANALATGHRPLATASSTGHRPPVFAFLALVLASGFTFACQSTAPEDLPAAKPVVQAPKPDPRVAEMQVMIAELLDRIEVLNARLQRLESGSSPAPATAAVRPASTGSATRAAVTPATTSQPRAATQSLTGAALDARYRAALAAYGKGELDKSRKLFLEVFDADPSGDLADNALYWIAETYYVTGNYPQAMETYRLILKDHSGENKAPDAMLKLGMAYVKIGDLALAKTTFQQLIQKYPYSTPATSARLEIKRIQY